MHTQNKSRLFCHVSQRTLCATLKHNLGQLRSVGHLNHCPKADNGIAIAPPLNIRTLQY